MPAEDTQFRPGNPGGPGRPKGSVSLTSILRRKLAEGGQAEAEAVVDAWIASGKAGDMRAIKELVDRIDGKVPDRVEQSGDLTVRVEYADPHADPAPAPPGPDDDPQRM